MPLSLLFEERERRVFLSLRQLDDPPAHVWRRDGMTLLTCDPRCTRLEITTRNMQILTSGEIGCFRRAFGLPPIGTHADDWIVEEAPAFLWVPPGLRLDGAAAIQGGAELDRRRRAGLLAEEQAAWRAELHGVHALGA